jgi:hypothetical protein
MKNEEHSRGAKIQSFGDTEKGVGEKFIKRASVASSG